MVTTNDIIKNLQESDASEADKVYMFIQIIDKKAVVDELKKKAVLANIGMDRIDPLAEFSYAVLKLACPHLFIGD